MLVDTSSMRWCASRRFFVAFLLRPAMSEPPIESCEPAVSGYLSRFPRAAVRERREHLLPALRCGLPPLVDTPTCVRAAPAVRQRCDRLTAHWTFSDDNVCASCGLLLCVPVLPALRRELRATRSDACSPLASWRPRVGSSADRADKRLSLLALVDIPHVAYLRVSVQFRQPRVFIFPHYIICAGQKTASAARATVSAMSLHPLPSFSQVLLPHVPKRNRVKVSAMSGKKLYVFALVLCFRHEHART